LPITLVHWQVPAMHDKPLLVLQSEFWLQKLPKVPPHTAFAVQVP
jgi:hypothetical protein